MPSRPIYLDHHATTPTDPRVLEVMLPYFTHAFGNAASSSHVYGWEAEAAVTQARETLAAAINCSPEEIIFTSGATEANNLAIKGVAEAYLSKGRHLISVTTEHNAVLDPVHYLQGLGFEVTLLGVDSQGLIDLRALEQAIRPDTVLISVMAANNEIGVLQPLTQIGALAKQHNVLFHTDAAQAVGKIPLDVQAQNIDLMSLTAHKVYGPKGIGALYVRRRDPRVKLAPQMHGGGHERGLRSGTLFVPQIAGLGKAVELAMLELESEAARLTSLREQLWQQLQVLDDLKLNGHPGQRLPGNLNVCFGGVDGEALLIGLRQVVALSSGSACTSAEVAPSHVLKALGRTDQEAHAALRFGLGRFNTTEEVDQVAVAVVDTVQKLRKMAMTWR
ncbi:IscS subfamily cysteine desulfurase [Leptolyngbya sp. FACHB-261]|nr:IscS subfamily cysteine desulfurase [Leptolyngbya sp. FACHB-261]